MCFFCLPVGYNPSTSFWLFLPSNCSSLLPPHLFVSSLFDIFPVQCIKKREWTSMTYKVKDNKWVSRYFLKISHCVFFVSVDKLIWSVFSRHLKPSMRQSFCGVQPHGVSCRRCHVTPSPSPRWPSPPTHGSYWLCPVIAPGLYGDGTCRHLKILVR